MRWRSDARAAEETGKSMVFFVFKFSKSVEKTVAKKNALSLNIGSSTAFGTAERGGRAADAREKKQDSRPRKGIREFCKIS